MPFKWFKNIGPGPLIAAAFIGPGTVTVCTLAGTHFGYALLWAMALSILATITLQEMAARLGIVTQKGLSEIIRSELKNPILKSTILLLIVSAIVIGNAAYEAGNITGGVLGLEAFFGPLTFRTATFSVNSYGLIIGVLAFALLYLGNYKILEKALVALVVLMSCAFLTTAIISAPNLSDILKGLFFVEIPKTSVLTIIALIGTTVVPYNLFLHAALVKEKWTAITDLKHAKRDTITAVLLGGIVSMSIIITAATTSLTNITDAADLAKGLEPLFGRYSTFILAMGLFAAGVTSAITAPLAAAFVAKGCFGWSGGMKSKKFRWVWMLILGLGVVLSSLGIKPIEIIKFAQVTNGLLLPIIAGLLLWIMNKKSILGPYANGRLQNVLGICIVVITLFLGLKSILSVFNIL